MTRGIMVVAALALAGCAPVLTQRIEGVVTADGAPLPSGEVRLVSGKESNTCLGKKPLKAPVRAVAFSLEREVEGGPDKIQRDGLCIKDAGIWTLAWHSVYGPAPETLSFACNRESGQWTCKANGLTSN
jgi:hypothetical protein